MSKLMRSQKHFAKGRLQRNPKGKRRCWCEECTGTYDKPFERVDEKSEARKEIETQMKDMEDEDNH